MCCPIRRHRGDRGGGLFFGWGGVGKIPQRPLLVLGGEQVCDKASRYT